MAAPAEMNTRDISGKYMMACVDDVLNTAFQSHTYPQNKTLSDSSEEILRLQGVSWFVRRTIALATLYLDIKHDKGKDGDDVEHIDVDQTLTGGIKGTKENRILDWTEREHEDHVFGAVISRSRRVTLGEIEQDWLKKDWLDDSFADGKIIYTVAKSNTAKSGTTWTAEQVWGFELVNGEKRYTRHVYFTGPGEEIVTIRLVYDYLGSL